MPNTCNRPCCHHLLFKGNFNSHDDFTYAAKALWIRMLLLASTLTKSQAPHLNVSKSKILADKSEAVALCILPYIKKITAFLIPFSEKVTMFHAI